MSTKKRLFLLDAYALIFRGYYAFIKNPRINSKEWIHQQLWALQIRCWT